VPAVDPTDLFRWTLRILPFK